MQDLENNVVEPVEEIEEVEEAEEVEQVEETEQPEPAESEEKKERVVFDDAQQEVVNKIIGKKTAKMHEIERRAEEAERRAEELESKIPQPVKPDIPPVPDRYDFDSEADYLLKLSERDDAIKKAVAFEAQAEARQQAELKRQQDAEYERQLQYAKKAEGYTAKANALGITPEQIQQSGTVLAHAGISEDVAEFLLDDDDGPLMAQYLSRNPLELEELRNMAPMRAAVFLDSKVRAKASGLKAKKSKAPEPSDRLSGKGAPEKGGKFIGNATFS